MPASYAHYRFGRQIFSELPTDVRQCIQRFRRMFDAGLYGPDIFFYYNPLIKTAVGDLGGTFHHQTGAAFFPSACAQASSEAAEAYLYGLLAHYCLDSVSHPFVQQVVGAEKATHAALEAEFDRFLMELDGIAQPHTYDLSAKMKLTRGECMTVAAFYPPATGGNVNLSIRNMALFHKFCANPNRQRTRKILHRVQLRLCDQLIPEAPVDAFARMDSELLVRFNRALKLYPVLLDQLRTHMRTGAELGEAFAPDFG